MPTKWQEIRQKWRSLRIIKVIVMKLFYLNVLFIDEWNSLIRNILCVGFAYFKQCTTIHRSISQHMARNYSKRFSFGTVPEVESTMERVFTVSPSSAQIVADILRLETVLDMIIKERGAIVPELNFRRGYRALTHDKKGLLKNALKRSSRVSTYSLPAMHPMPLKQLNSCGCALLIWVYQSKFRQQKTVDLVLAQMMIHWFWS